MRPKELIKQWVELFNQCDTSALADLYHEDAINHQVANEPIEGKKNILKMFTK